MASTKSKIPSVKLGAPTPKDKWEVVRDHYEEVGVVEVRKAEKSPESFLRRTIPLARKFDDMLKGTKKLAELEYENRFKKPLIAALKALSPDNTTETIAFEVKGSKASLERPKTEKVTDEAPVLLEAMVMAGKVDAKELLGLVKDLLPSMDPATARSFIEAKLVTLSAKDKEKFTPAEPVKETVMLGERLKVGPVGRGSR